MSWIRRETEKEAVQYICPHCHDYHEFREDFGERTFSENYIFCRRCGARNGTGNAPTLTPQNEPRAGLYGKYTVYKNKDGSLVTDCFILRPAKDPAAVAALRAYATATDNAELSADIINWIGAEPNEWVSVEERLPEHLKDVLALYGNGKIDIDWVDSSGNFKFGSLFDGVTHWMPLPAPPDKEQTT